MSTGPERHVDRACRLAQAAALGFLFALLLVAAPAGSAARESARPAAQPPTPGSYGAWLAQQPPPSPLRVDQVYASPSPAGAGAPVACALVHPDLYPGLAPSLATWAADLEREGWSVLLYSASYPDPPALRAHLAAIPGLRGCLLVGDTPVPWFRLGDKDFPFDLYYMDLDGTWHDDDADGLYEDHTGEIRPEIWIGRLTAGNLTFGGDELALVENYFRKNHAYRSGELLLPARALVYADDDWSTKAAGFGASVALLYPDTTVISEVETTRADDYGRRLGDYYAWTHLFAHSTAGYHVFVYHNEDPSYAHVLYNENVYDLDPRGFFYNLHACGAGRYTEPDYLAGWYVFADSYGLAVWSHTSSGSMVRGFTDFYTWLSLPLPIGQAYLNWFDTWGIEDRAWHYGMVLLGDPTLVVNTKNPSGEPPAALTLAGPASISLGRTETLSATVAPASAAQPLMYTWQATDKAPIAHKGGPQDAAALAWWSTPGLKTVAVTVTNPFGSATARHTLVVDAPEAGLAPHVLSETLVLGTALTRTLALSNGGPGELDFRLGEAAQAVPAAAGRDLFGYSYRDSTQAGGPAYHWIEIAPPAGGSGTELAALTGASNAYLYPVPLPFTFRYYGREYDELTVHSDGVLSWRNRAANHHNLPLPAARGYEIVEFLAPFWDDLRIAPGAIYVQQVGSAFVVEYHHVSQQGDASDPGTWEVVLYPNGNILFQYQDVDLGGTAADAGASATVGIQGGALTGLQYAYNAPALSAGLAICFAYPGQWPECSAPLDVPWLSTSPDHGTVAPGGGRSLDLVLDARPPHVAGPGLYQATLVAQTNDPQQGLLNLPVTMTVLAPAYGLAVAPRAADRSGVPGQSLAYTLLVTNTGNLADAFDVQLSAAWPTNAPAAIGPLAPGQGAPLTVAVAIPPHAAPGAADRATLTLSSRADPAARATAILTTTAAAPPPSPHILYLPLLIH